MTRRKYKKTPEHVNHVLFRLGGVVYPFVQAPERTRAVASFFRDAAVSSSDSVMVVVTLALDTPRLTPLVTAWERAPFEPEAAPDEVRQLQT